MKFGYVLLGLVTLTSIHISNGQCSNGLAGVENDDICCAESCGTCGGSRCARRPGGGDNCCTGRIEDSGDMCSVTGAAPCIMDDIVIPDTTCSNGLPGVDNGQVCCTAGCGTCGGSGCSRRPGGGENCCSGAIEDSGDLCSVTLAAPCIMDVDINPTCTNNLPGIQSGSICCEAQCGTCGGAGCAGRPGGETSCCTSIIMSDGMNCTTAMAAPCIVDGDFPEVPVALCSNGVVGVENGGFCCEAGCGTCGGSGCSRRPGGGDACCTSRIEDSGVMCDDMMTAPCIV